MIRLSIALIALGLSSPAWAAQFPCSNAAVSPYPALEPTDHDHARWKPNANGLSKQFTAFYSMFDGADDDTGDGQADLRLNPEFVAYELRGLAADAVGDYPEPSTSIRRPSRWYASPELVPLVQNLQGMTSTRIDDSYSGIGEIWNRGHLTMSDHAQRISVQASCNTHNFFNASPQAEDLNQGPWRHLENYSAAAANKFRSVWVIAGPIFDSSTPRLTIGDPGELPIEIPDAFFKVLIHESPSGIDTLAFIFEQPNARNSEGVPIPTATWVNCNQAQRAHHVYDHRPKLVSIAQIESRTGLRFFSNRSDRTALIAATPSEVWPVESKYWDPDNTCANQRSHP